MHNKSDTGDDASAREDAMAAPAEEPGSSWIRGRYLAAFEVSSFQPEGSTERWWTSFDERLGNEARELVESARGTPVEVELAGKVSDPGEYGHMGFYNREFTVHAIRRKAK